MARILAVGSEPFLGRALREHGADVDEVPDSARALGLVDAGSYRLVLLDLPLAGCDGLELLRRLLEARPERPVVVLCGVRELATRARCIDLGAAETIAKPISLPDLLGRLRPMLEGAGGDSVLRAGAVTLDLVRRAVLVGAVRVSLTGREFRLLRHLMLHRGEVCTRMELLAEVWGYTFDPGTNVVDVYIRRLRAKVGTARVETIRGVGYAFESLPVETAQAVAG